MFYFCSSRQTTSYQVDLKAVKDLPRLIVTNFLQLSDILRLFW